MTVRRAALFPLSWPETMDSQSGYGHSTHFPGLIQDPVGASGIAGGL